MRKNSLIILGCAVVLIAGMTATAWAGLSPEEIAKLGTTLTPLGAEKAGNADGTIPAWEGGLSKPPAAWKPGTHYINPYADDKILFTITSENVDQYADKLTVGQKALFATYPDTYEMNIYPTRRSAAVPQRIYDATKHIAATAELVEGGNGIAGAVNGIPFPIPKVGVECIWNHIVRYRADSASRDIGQAAPTRGGDYTHGSVPRRVLHGLQHAGHERRKAQQPDPVLQTGSDGASASGRRHSAGSGDPRPGQGKP